MLSAKLSQPEVLRAQTERLLQAGTLERFVTDFTDGWLNLREIEFTTPDKQLYPEYDGLLLNSMLRETRGFITHLITQNLSLANVIHSDFAMLNGRLARHYGIPGVSGVGPKTAAKWIREYGSLAGLVDHVEEVRGKVGDALRANLSSVLTNRELTELVRDVALPAGPDDLALVGWDREEIHKLFDDLEFRVLRDRLFSTLSSAEPEAEEGFDLDGEALAPGAVRAWLDAHARTGRSGVMVSGPQRVVDSDVEAVAIAAADEVSAYIDPTTMTPDDEEALVAWFADPSADKALHEAKWAYHALRGRGWSLAGVSSDTSLAAYLARPGQRSFNLDDLAVRYLKRELRVDSAAPDDGQLSLLDGDGDDGQRADELMLAARAVVELAAALDEELERLHARDLLADVELPLLFVLADLEAAGIAVDVAYLQSLEQGFAERVRAAAEIGRAHV